MPGTLLRLLSRGAPRPQLLRIGSHHASFAAEVEPSNGAQSEVLIGHWRGSSCGSAVSRPVLASMPIMCTLLRPLSTGGHVQMASACLFPYLQQKSMCLALFGSASVIGRAGCGGTAGEVSEECGLCVCGSVRFVVRWWLEKTGLSSCRAMNLSGSEL